MSFQAMAWASEQTTGSATRKAVLYALANHANKDGICLLRVETISEEAELGSTATKNALRDLSDAGLVERDRKRRRDGYLGCYEFRLALKTRGVFSDTRLETRGVPKPQTRGVQQEPGRPSEPKDLSPASPSKAERDLVFDALTALFGPPETPEHARRYGKVQRTILASNGLSPAQVAAQVPIRAAAYRKQWPDVSFTLEAFAKHWPDLRPAATTSAPSEIPTSMLSPEDFAVWKRNATPWEIATYQDTFDTDDRGEPL